MKQTVKQELVEAACAGLNAFRQASFLWGQQAEGNQFVGRTPSGQISDLLAQHKADTELQIF